MYAEEVSCLVDTTCGVIEKYMPKLNDMCFLLMDLVQASTHVFGALRLPVLVLVNLPCENKVIPSHPIPSYPILSYRILFYPSPRSYHILS